MLLKKLDQNKNVWIGDKRKKNIWDRRKNIDKLVNKEATTSVSVPGYLSPVAFSKSTQKAIDVDDEDDEKSESMAAPFRRRNSRGLGRVMKVGLNEGKWSKIMTSVRKGSKSGPWSIVVYKNKKVLHQRLVKILQQIPAHYEDVKKKYPKASIGIEDKYGERVYTESVNEADLGLTYKRGKTVKVTHKKSGKELVIIDKPNVKKEYEKIGYFAEGKVDEISMKMQPFSSQEARLQINSDIKDMSNLLGKTSQQVIKIMMDGVKNSKYDAMDIQRGLKEGPAGRTHFGEMTFIRSLWGKVRDGFRRYSKTKKLRR